MLGMPLVASWQTSNRRSNAIGQPATIFQPQQRCGLLAARMEYGIRRHGEFSAEQCGMNAIDSIDSKSRSAFSPNSKIHSKSHAKPAILAQDGTGFPATVVEATPTIAEKPYITEMMGSTF